MMKNTRRGMKRFVKGYAFLLLLCMLFSACMSAAAEGLSVAKKVVDPSTVDSWKAFFGPKADTTEYAGKVWTDKSVFKDAASAVSAADNGVTRKLLPEDTTLEGEDSFLVVLSAMAANKSIEGFEYMPTDTMLVLDMSSSMKNDVEELCRATNIALTKLLALNQNNRVGVVAYSGNDHNNYEYHNSNTKILMPLDRYSTSKDEEFKENDIIPYLMIDKNNKQKIRVNEDDLTVYRGVGENKQKQTGECITATGTWIQDGAFEAMKQLTKTADIEVKEGIQAGARRTPIIVLMTDGAPSVLTADYYGNRDRDSDKDSYYHSYQMTLSDGGTEEIYGSLGKNQYIYNSFDQAPEKKVFLTQLSIAYAREQVKKHYGCEPMLYTLGFNVRANGEEELIMNPKKTESNNTLKGYWSAYKGKEHGVKYTIAGLGPSVTLTRHSDVKGYNYVDEYFTASSNGLEGAFEKIVQRIVLQSLYYPTEASDNRHEYGGYIEFLDDIGEFMEVKDVKGVRLNNTFYSGKAFAKMLWEMKEGMHAEEAAEFIESIRVRLGLNSADEVRALLDVAANKGHLKYETNGDYSNYVGWYADKDRKYIPYDSNNNPPTGDNVKYYIKSYSYIGDVKNQGLGSDAAAYRATDMMYAAIRVETELETGHEQVIFKVPAALIPLYSYEVKLPDGATQIDDGQIVTVDRPGENAVYPIRLIYEVGVRDDITAFNFAGALEKYKANPGHQNQDYPHKDTTTGDYYLYTNKWDKTEFESGNKSPQNEVNMIAWYEPSRENERFFYTQDTVIYTVTGTDQTNYEATPCTNQNNKPSGNQYYRQHFVFEKLEGSNHWKAHAHYEKIAADTLEAAATFKDGRWIIPAGRVHRNIAGYMMWKGSKQSEAQYNADEDNPTGTLDYADYPAVEFNTSNLSAPYYVDAILGNNGRLTVTPATGLSIKKTVSSSNAPTKEFDIKISGDDITNGKSYSVLYSDAENSVTITAASDGLTITLKPDQTATVIGLTAGKSYTLTETLNGHWSRPKVKVNGGAYTEANSAGENTYTYAVTAVDRTIVEVEFQNIYSPNGTLVLAKNVTGEQPPHEYDPDFTFVVTLQGTDVDKTYQTSRGESVTAENGMFEIRLKAGEAVSVYDIGAGTQVTVEEIDIPAGFTQQSVVYNRNDHEISSDAALTATITNRYAPTWKKPGAEIAIDLTKKITGRAWKPGESFTFNLCRLTHDANGEIVPVEINEDPLVLAHNGDAQNVEQITETNVFSGLIEAYIQKEIEDHKLELGTHTFHIHEEIPAQPAGGMRYEQMAASILVTVGDVGGYLTITDVSAGQLAHLEQSSNNDNNGDKSWKISATFTNSYFAETEALFTLPVVKEIYDLETGKVVDTKLGQSLEGFAFVLKHNGNEVARAESDEDGRAVLMVTDIKNATDRENPLVYTLVEEASGRPGMRDDAVEWTVKVSVTDDLNGSLIAKVESITSDKQDALHPTITPAGTYAVPFCNMYTQNAVQIEIPVLKTVNNITGNKMGPEGFAFVLKDEKGEERARAVSDANGHAKIGFVFKEQDVGVHNWTVQEEAGNVPNMVYSTVVYPVQIKVVRDAAAGAGEAVMTAAVTCNGAAIDTLAFENIYGSTADLNLPATGDTSNLLGSLMALMAAAAGFLFVRSRRKERN